MERQVGGVSVKAPTTRLPSTSARLVPEVLAVVTVALQIAYPLLDGDALRRVTVVTVLAFAAASVSHAWVYRGAAWALGLAGAAAGAGYAAEAVGVATGFPFGSYSYAVTLGPRVLGVPLLVPLAWVMFAYPSLLVARRVAGGRWVPLVFAVSMTAWDVSLDPQMVAAGHWGWDHPTPALPGVPGIPLTNFAGWLLVSGVLGLLLHRLPERHVGLRADAVPIGLFLWTWLGGIVGNAVFMGRPGVALVGGTALAVVGFPLLRSLAAELAAAPRLTPGRR